MKEMSATDKELLSLIVTLTANAQGQPPTLAELAVGAGLQSSSKANIHRQLKRLKPVYVDWDSNSSRSLRVTPTGLVALGLQEMASVSNKIFSDSPASDIIITLLASGLVNMISERVNRGKAVQVPYSRDWQRGLNMLALEWLLRVAEPAPPTHLAEVVGWCKRPLAQWPLRFGQIGQLLNNEDALLDEDEQPTEFCRELTVGLPKHNVELELYENRMAQVRQKAEQFQREQDYITFRQFLIEHPVVTLEKLTMTSLSPEFDAFGSELYEMYERVPASIMENNQVFLCGFCGWTLERSPVTGRFKCGSERCQLLTANFTRGTQSLVANQRVNLQRVNRAIRQYVVAPGKYEIDTWRQLEALGVKTRLWPGYDRYDLRLEFPGTERWAVDVKDWRQPFLLLKNLSPLANEGVLTYDRAFYAIPDERVNENKAYLEFLRNSTHNQPFEVVRLSELLKLAQVRLSEVKSDNDQVI